jgi:hypothetical protein
MMNGDISAGQYHSGVVASLAEGAAFAVAQQMTHLLKRQQHLDKLHQQKEECQYVRASRYDSTYREPKYAMDDDGKEKVFRLWLHGTLDLGYQAIILSSKGGQC